MLKLAYNTTDQMLLVDGSAGFTIGGRSWGVVDTTDAVGQAELDAKRLVLVDEDALRGSDNPEVVAAVAALDERSARLSAAKSASKAELVEALGDDDVAELPVGGDGLPPKDALVDAVVAHEVDVPPSTTKTTKPRSGQK